MGCSFLTEDKEVGCFLNHTYLPGLLPHPSFNHCKRDQEAQVSGAVVPQELLLPVSGSQTPIRMCCCGGNLEKELYTMEERKKMDENREKTKDSTRTDHQPWLSSSAIKEYRQVVPTLDQLHLSSWKLKSFDRYTHVDFGSS